MSNQDQKDKIIKAALSAAPTRGWSKQTLADAAKDAGFDPLMAEALFPSLKDATSYVSDYFDALLMAQLGIADKNMRTRDKIAHAVMTRLDLMAPYRDGLKSVMAARLRLRGAKSLWRTADKIWIWAGDTATDYNKYTKRALLSGVILSTTLFWFNDNSPGFRATSTFLERRIAGILNTGKMIGMLKQMATRKTAAAILLCLLFTSPVQAQTTKMTSQDLMNLYVGPTDETMTALDKAHRSEREMGDWAFETVAEALQFEPGKVNAKLAAIKPYFSDTGYKAYLAFLTSQPFAPALSSQTLKLATIVNNAPLLIGQGASGGRYAWAFELPVVMTPADQKSVGPITLRVQIGRNAKAPEPQGVIIENWQVFQENVQNPMPNPNTP